MIRLTKTLNSFSISFAQSDLVKKIAGTNGSQV